MKLLVALDRSSFAEEVLPPIAAIVAAGNAEVVLVTVVKKTDLHETRTGPPPAPLDMLAWPDFTGRLLPYVVVAPDAPVETRAQAEQRVKIESKEYLEGIARRWFPQGAEAAVLRGDDVAEELAGYAREHNVDVIAMATHGRTGLVKVLMGSVASALLRSRVAPVLLVRPNTL